MECQKIVALLRLYLNLWVKFTAVTQGRDKTCRIIQYLSRFLAPYLQRNGYSKETVAMFSAVKSTVGSARKVFRMGRSLDFVNNAFKAQLENCEFSRVGLTVKSLSMALWMLFDNLQLLQTMKVINVSKSTLKGFSTKAFRFWLMGLLASAAVQAYSLQSMAKQMQEFAHDRRRVKQLLLGSNKLASEKLELELEAIKQSQKALEVKMQKTGLQLVQDTLDSCIPGTALGYLKFSDETVGLIGFITGIMGFRTVWQSVNGKK